MRCIPSHGDQHKTFLVWYKNGKKMRFFGNKNLVFGGPHKGILRIRSATLKDKASYTCKAHDEFSRDQLTFNVNVLGDWQFMIIKHKFFKMINLNIAKLSLT